MNEKILEVLKYLFLSLLQGITEVLPISSSGHLQIASEVLKILSPPNSCNTLCIITNIGIENIPNFNIFGFFQKSKAKT